jgi:hypothetical protein
MSIKRLVSIDERCVHVHFTDIHYNALSEVNFQDGPINEVGVNGVQVSDLLQLCVRKLRQYQLDADGKWACPENQSAIDYIESALGMLDMRLRERISRGVDGTSNV